MVFRASNNQKSLKIISAYHGLASNETVLVEPWLRPNNIFLSEAEAGCLSFTETNHIGGVIICAFIK
jgi:hypothetical protein